MPYPAQLQAKQARLARAFARYPHLPAVPEVQPAARTEGYRHRLKLPLEIGADRVRIGLSDPATGRILDTPDCPVLAPGLREALAQLLPALAGKRGIHSLDLRVSNASGEVQAVLACEGGQLPGGAKAGRDLLRRVPTLSSLAVSEADPEGKRVMGRRPHLVAGRATIGERIGETGYHLYPGAFFQVDPLNADWIHHRVSEWAGEAKGIVDLYAGVGAFARLLAPGRGEVLAVEEVPAAAKAAGIEAPAGMRVIEGRVEQVDLPRKVDLVVMNPARRGSDPTTLARVARMTDRLIYVSCSPETLARDLDCLAAHGLRVAEVAAIDLFPQTTEVETVVRLERGSVMRDWRVPGGKATHPWGDRPSGALGRPEQLVALVIGRTPDHLALQGGRVTFLGEVASHSLVRIELGAPLIPALAELARRGFPVAGRDQKTQRFFADKVGLVRPFVHVSRASGVIAPLHGDLVATLEALGAPDRLLLRAGADPERIGPEAARPAVRPSRPPRTRERVPPRDRGAKGRWPKR